jgi:nicotinamidase-related amidase
MDDIKDGNTNSYQMKIRKIVETGKSGDFEQLTGLVAWDPARTAVIICDMWNLHWCAGTTRRVAEMAPRMNEVVRELRGLGMLIIHAPSGTMPFYAEYPGRKRALAAASDAGWSRDLVREPFVEAAEIPVDSSDWGCWCEPKCPVHFPWTRQQAQLEIMDEDGIADDLEIFALFRQHSIQNVIMMGVASNMCVIERPFGIRRLVGNGLDVVLVRDMTDSMYNPAMSPFVDHFTGNDLVVWHIEKYLCPTVTSDQIIGGQPFRFQEDSREQMAEYRDYRTLI